MTPCRWQPEGRILSHTLGAAGRPLGLDQGQARLKMLGLETTAGVAVERAHEQSFGLVVLDVIIALPPAPAISLASWSTRWRCRRCPRPVLGPRTFRPLRLDGRSEFANPAGAAARSGANPAPPDWAPRTLAAAERAVVGHKAQTAAALFLGDRSIHPEALRCLAAPLKTSTANHRPIASRAM